MKKFPLKHSSIITGSIFGLIAGLGVVANWWQPFESAGLNHLLGISVGLLVGAFVGFLAYDWNEVIRTIPIVWRQCVKGFVSFIGFAIDVIVVGGQALAMTINMIAKGILILLYGISWGSVFICPLLYIFLDGYGDNNNEFIVEYMIIAMGSIVPSILAMIYMHDNNRCELPRDWRTINSLLWKASKIYWGFYLRCLIGLLMGALFLFILPFKFAYLIVYHTWSAPRLFHAAFSAFAVSVGYPVGIALNAILPAIAIGLAVGLVAAQITHHYLSKREEELRPLSWHPLKIFVKA